MKPSKGKRLEDRAVQGYARDLARVVILDAPTERKVFARYKATGDIDARNMLVESGLRFVIKVAQAFARDLEHHKQLISAGNEGLLVAVDRFDVTRGTRFLSYATWWVTLYIREELHRSQVVTIPMWRKKSLRKVRAAREAVRDNTGREATEKEIRTATGLSKQQLAGLAQETYEIVSLDDANTASAGIDTEGEVISAMGDRLLRLAISQMPIREAFVCRAYFGFLTDPPMSLKQVASVLGISSERVRQIKMEALTILRRNLESLDINAVDDVYDT